MRSRIHSVGSIPPTGHRTASPRIVPICSRAGQCANAQKHVRSKWRAGSGPRRRCRAVRAVGYRVNSRRPWNEIGVLKGGAKFSATANCCCERTHKFCRRRRRIVTFLTSVARRRVSLGLGLINLILVHRPAAPTVHKSTALPARQTHPGPDSRPPGLYQSARRTFGLRRLEYVWKQSDFERFKIPGVQLHCWSHGSGASSSFP